MQKLEGCFGAKTRNRGFNGESMIISSRNYGNGPSTITLLMLIIDYTHVYSVEELTQSLLPV